MTPSIEIDDETFEYLKENAEPLVDSPSTVLRRLLGLGENSGPENKSQSNDAGPVSAAEPTSRRKRPRKRRRRSSRAPSGSLLPESEYELPILQVLERSGGRAASREVVAEVGKIVKDRLTPVDLQKLASGGLRWENRVHFTRLRLIEEGFLKEGSPRGVWELAETGRTRAKKG